MRILFTMLSLVVTASTSAGPASYHCNDVNGGSRYQDTPCFGGPSPTEIDAIEDAKRIAVAKATAAAAEARRLRLLLQTYPSPAALQAARAAELQKQVDLHRQSAAREAKLHGKRTKLLQDAEFYIPMHKPLPPDLNSSLDAVDAELTAQSQAGQNLDQADVLINKRYDVMQADLLPLWTPSARPAGK